MSRQNMFPVPEQKLDPPEGWYCADCGESCGEDELDEENLCPDCAGTMTEEDDESE